MSPGSTHYVVLPESLRIEDSGCKMDLFNKEKDVTLTAEIYSVNDNMFRLKIDEKNPIRQRYQVEGSLVGEPKLDKYGPHPFIMV